MSFVVLATRKQRFDQDFAGKIWNAPGSKIVQAASAARAKAVVNASGLRLAYTLLRKIYCGYTIRPHNLLLPQYFHRVQP